MLCLVKVLRGMFVFRAIAAADMPAGLAQTQVHPRVANLQTILAPTRARLDLSYLVQMRARRH